MKDNEVESNGSRVGVVASSTTESVKMLRTLTPRERGFILEQIRHHGVQEDRNRVRRQRYEAMIRHDNCILAANDTSSRTKITEAEQ